MSPIARRPLALVAVLLMLVPATVVLPTAEAGPEGTPWKLPRPVWGHASVWTGERVLTFGGFDGSAVVDIISSFDPATGVVETKGARLPGAGHLLAAAWDGKHAYVIGSTCCGGDVLRYDPINDTLTRTGAVMDPPRYGASAFSDGRYVYFIGGIGRYITDHYGYLNDIVRYDPQTNRLETMAVAFKEGLYATSVAWDGGTAFIFGGHGCDPSYRFVILPGHLPGVWPDERCATRDTIHRYHPASNALTTGGRLPSPRHHSAAVMAGDAAVSIGGHDGANAIGEVARYDPASRSTRSEPASLAQPRSAPTAVWTGTAAYVLGGSGPGTPATAEIVRYVFPPNAPRSLALSNATAKREIELTWDAPLPNGRSTVTGYQVAREQGGGFAVVAHLPSDARRYLDAGLAGNVEYRYFVRAMNGGATGELALGSARTQRDAPHAPANFAASDRGAPGEIVLTWLAPSNDGGEPLLGYAIHVAQPGGGYAELARIGTNTSYVDRGLAPGVERTYYVTARNLHGDGAPSRLDVGRAPSAPPAPVIKSVARITGTDAVAMRIAFDVPGDGGNAVSHCRLYRALQGEEPQLVNGNVFCRVGSDFVTEDQGRPFNVTYTYALTVVNAVGEGARAALDAYTREGRSTPPRNLTARTGDTLGSIALAWEVPENTGGYPVVDYVVRRLVPGVASPEAEFVVTQTSYVDTGLGDGVTREYDVYARTGHAYPSHPSARAVAKTIVTPPTEPRLPRAERAGEQIHVSWSAPALDNGAPVTRYVVERGSSPNATQRIAEVTNTSFYDADVVPNSAYYYRIAAVNVAGVGALSAAAGTSLQELVQTTLEFPFTVSEHGFRREADRPWSDVYWDSSNGRVRLISDHRSLVDELYARRLTDPLEPERSFAASFRWGAEEDCCNQRPMPFFLAAENVTDVLTQNNTLVVHHTGGWSDASGVRYRVLYRDASGVARLDEPIALPYKSTYSGTIDYDAPTGSLVVTLRDASGAERGRVTYRVGSNAGDGFVFGKLGVGADGNNAPTTDGTWRGWADDLRLVYERDLTDSTPTAPTLSARTGNASGSVELTWTHPLHNGGWPVTGYRIYRGTDPSAVETLVGNATTEAPYLDVGVQPGVSYHYRVAAMNERGEGDLSPVATSRAARVSLAPTSVGASPGPARGEVLVRWLPPADNGTDAVVGYRVYGRNATGAFALLRELDASARNWTQAGLADGERRWYRVVAITRPGEGAAAEASGHAPHVSDPPHSLSALSAYPGEVWLGWRAGLDGGAPVTRFRIYRGESPDAVKPLDEVGPTLRYTDRTATVGKVYYYRVSAINLVGESVLSREAVTYGNALPTQQSGVDPLALLLPDPGIEGKHTFAGGPEGFGKEAERPYSDVGWDPKGQRIRMLANRMDSLDEVLAHPTGRAWTPNASFEVSARFLALRQGNWQGAFPLFVAGAEPGGPAGRNVVAFHYLSRDLYRYDLPVMTMTYHDATGALRIAESVAFPLAMELTLRATYDAATGRLTLAVGETGHPPMVARDYVIGSAPGDGFSFGKVGIASQGMPLPFELPMEGWVDDVTVRVGPTAA